MQNSSSNFFQQQSPLKAEGERVGIVFANLYAIHKYREELFTVIVVGIGTFKTVPRCPPQFTKGCLLTFQAVLKNVSIVRYCRRSINSIFNLFQSSPEVAKILHMILALPHLPAEVNPNCRFTIFFGFRVAVKFANQHTNISQRLEIFLFSYVQDFRLIEIGAAISVYGSDVRTNNYLESFHATLLNQMGKHPNIWDFLCKINFVK